MPNELTAAPVLSGTGPNHDTVFDRPLTFAPRIPEFILRDEAVYIQTDNRFTAAARLLSSLWRIERNIPAGSIPAASGRQTNRRMKLGSRISAAAAKDGATFVSPAVMRLAQAELLFREPGSVWDEERLWGNLLSSQALTINLWAPMALDLDLATAVWKCLLPDFVASVLRIRFEHSPGRFQENYFGDGTAFDVLAEVVTPDGDVAVLTVEMKYVEELLSAPARHRERYDVTTRDSGLYDDPEDPLLRRSGIEQLRREHVMTQLIVDYGLANRGTFITIAPRLNRRAMATNSLYASTLSDGSGATAHEDGRNRVGFRPLTLEDIVSALRTAGAEDHASAIWGRYLDFKRVVQHVLHKIVSTPTGQDFQPELLAKTA